MSVRWLALQSCSFRGNDESPYSLNRGNFLEMVDAFGKMNTKIGEVVLEIGDAKFSILVDEARDASSQEQMAIILSVSDTTSLNLKNQVFDVLVCFNLQVQNMRGQGYDGANNMHGSWNGQQALFLRDCPYAYYVHCFTHRLQLMLVSAARDVVDTNSFFSDLDNVINMITSSPKRFNELKSSKKKKKEIEHLLEIGEGETGSGANQIGNLQRARGTRWSSHYNSAKSLIDMYAATCKVLEYLSDHSPNVRTRCALSSPSEKTQDILTAMRFVHTTKTIIQELRENHWEKILEEVNCFCSKNDIHILDLHGSYMVGRSRGREYPTIEHHYHFDIFNAAIDFLVTELDARFNETSLELLSLGLAFDPKNSFESFNMDNICKLTEKFYPQDFTQQDIYSLKVELQH
ncbi:zinc finger MYM-type protein 1-like [Olea europaea var. sylvestris]|uniref:zinc finger MYM-type protein 1-like n=1 Tax=Olea europaea var. sylvestris TaxID=158386 RepID=UPI000C1CCDCD|nr:zinc finger MYM-type protein 1-like [Olea europaea var. sylvestris]